MGASCSRGCGTIDVAHSAEIEASIKRAPLPSARSPTTSELSSPTTSDEADAIERHSRLSSSPGTPEEDATPSPSSTSSTEHPTDWLRTRTLQVQARPSLEPLPFAAAKLDMASPGAMAATAAASIVRADAESRAAHAPERFEFSKDASRIDPPSSTTHRDAPQLPVPTLSTPVGPSTRVLSKDTSVGGEVSNETSAKRAAKSAALESAKTFRQKRKPAKYRRGRADDQLKALTTPKRRTTAAGGGGLVSPVSKGVSTPSGRFRAAAGTPARTLKAVVIATPGKARSASKYLKKVVIAALSPHRARGSINDAKLTPGRPVRVEVEPPSPRPDETTAAHPPSGTIVNRQPSFKQKRRPAKKVERYAPDEAWRAEKHEAAHPPVGQIFSADLGGGGLMPDRPSARIDPHEDLNGHGSGSKPPDPTPDKSTSSPPPDSPPDESAVVVRGARLPLVGRVAGAAPPDPTPLQQPSSLGDADEDATCLADAAAAGDVAACTRLLASGASRGRVDSDGQCALHHACESGSLAVIKLLAPAPACEELFLCDRYQMTPYHLACENGDPAIVAYLLGLLSRQAEPNAQARAEKLRRGSALFLAQKGEHAQVVELITLSTTERGERHRR